MLMWNRMGKRLAQTSLFLGMGAVSSVSMAGGFYSTDRGVRGLGRGGAFVAGADDLGAITYNPAGLVHAPKQFLADASWLLFQSKYTREAALHQVDPNTGEPTGESWTRNFNSVEGTAPILPIPTLAVSHNFGLPNSVFALGLWSPSSAGARYPSEVDGEPNPGRYMLLNLDGSALVVPGVWAAHRLSKRLSVGIGVEMLMGQYRSLTSMSACLPERFLCASEDPDYDGVIQMDVGPIMAPTANLGVQFDPHDNVRLGASLQLPIYVRSAAKIRVRLPRAAVFESAFQDGEDAHVSMDFPWIARAGVEGRWSNLRTEVAFAYEAWSMHDKIHVVADNMILRDVVTFPGEYRVADQTITRNFQDTWSLHWGLETWFDVATYQLDLRCGLAYEPSAVPKSHLTTLTLDQDKVEVGVGGSLHIKNWRFDWVAARTFTGETHVAPNEARYELLNPVASNPATHPDYVNAGTYESSATVLGVGMAVNFL